jgi:hypothetical protein
VPLVLLQQIEGPPWALYWVGVVSDRKHVALFCMGWAHVAAIDAHANASLEGWQLLPAGEAAPVTYGL